MLTDFTGTLGASEDNCPSPAISLALHQSTHLHGLPETIVSDSNIKFTLQF